MPSAQAEAARDDAPEDLARAAADREGGRPHDRLAQDGEVARGVGVALPSGAALAVTPQLDLEVTLAGLGVGVDLDAGVDRQAPDQPRAAIVRAVGAELLLVSVVLVVMPFTPSPFAMANPYSMSSSVMLSCML